MIKPGYIRVSEILGQWDRFGAIDKQVLEAKAQLGTAVHEAIKAHQECIHLGVPENAFGYFESYLKWYEVTKPQIKPMERLYCDKLMITGELDALVSFVGGGMPIIVDWKCTAAIDDLHWQLQGCWYHYLCQANSIEVDDRILFVQLQKDGSAPKVREYKRSSHLMNVCMSAYICYRYLNKIDQKSPNQ